MLATAIVVMDSDSTQHNVCTTAAIMSNIPPIPPPTGEVPRTLKRIDQSRPDRRLNAVCFFLPLVACLLSPYQIGLMLGSFWPILIVAALGLPLFVPSSRLRRGRQAYASILAGLSLGCYLVVQQHYEEFVAINNSFP